MKAGARRRLYGWKEGNGSADAEQKANTEATVQEPLAIRNAAAACIVLHYLQIRADLWASDRVSELSGLKGYLGKRLGWAEIFPAVHG